MSNQQVKNSDSIRGKKQSDGALDSHGNPSTRLQSLVRGPAATFAASTYCFE